MTKAGAPRTGPLDGVVVIDLTRVLAGPYMTMVLADLGARVIKVEMPCLGDDARQFGPFVEGHSAYFVSINRGKESIALNLKEDEDRRLFEKMLLKSDVLVENYRVGTLDKLGYGWQALQKINARLIYGAVSGFGQTGPYNNRPAYDLVVQGMGGIMSLTGDSNTAPMRVGTSIGDITAGLFGLSGILSALYDREKTAVGSFVDVGMLDCQVAILENAISRYYTENQVPQPLGLRHPAITPFSGLRAKHDEFITIAVGNDKMFAVFCETIGRVDLLQDKRYVTNDLRTKNHKPLYEEIEKVLAQRTVSEWLDILQAAGIPCGPINDIEQVFTDPQVKARNMIVSATNQEHVEFKMPGNPIKNTSYEDLPTRQPAPKLDQHRQQILDWLNS